MQILALDTSTAWLSVAVFDGQSATVIRELAGTASSERILPLTAQVLAQAGTSLAELGGIAYGAGPGSFTGIRIACGVVQGLAFGVDLPVFGVSTLGAIAQTAWRTHGSQRVLACLDARMREVYVASYIRNDQGWARIGDPQACKPDDVELADRGEAIPNVQANDQVPESPGLTSDDVAWPAGRRRPAARGCPGRVRRCS
jgi:tRNA threonylcarbamoyladenosine biosynthesis protein TsaB